MPSFPLDIVGLAEMCGGIWSRQLSTSTYYRPGLRPGKITPNVISKGENFYQRLCYFYLLLLCALKYPIQCCLLSFRLKDVPVLLNRVMVKATHRLHLGFQFFCLFTLDCFNPHREPEARRNRLHLPPEHFSGLSDNLEAPISSPRS